MPSIKPFKGIIYNIEKVEDQKRVVAPPYDVIPIDLQEDLYRRNPYNVVRLTLGKTKEGDDLNDNRYTRAKKFFERWLRTYVLIQDKKDAIYVYSQRYRENGREIDRMGFIGLMKLDTGKGCTILPHENTLLAPKLDRLNLIRNVKANLEPIFVLYEDKAHNILKILKRVCSNDRPFIDIKFDGVKHRIWRLNNNRSRKRIERLMRPKRIYIADGHHRYEVARTYSIEIQNKDISGKVKRYSKYIMAYFVELNKKILTISPIHRLIKDIGILESEDINKRLSKFFDIEKLPDLNSLISKLNELKRKHAFGMYLGKGNYYILELNNPKILDKLIKNNSSDWKRLDVTIFHLFILEYVLGIRDEEDNVEFLKDAKLATRFVDKGKYTLAFFLNPTKVLQVKRIAKLGERMPRKATYFYPKPLSGLVINKL